MVAGFEKKAKIKAVIMRIDPDATKGLTQRQKAGHMSVTARIAASESAFLSGFGRSVRFCKDENGVPMQNNGVWWGVSHKPDVVAGAVSFSPVGIDIEVLKAVSRGLAEKVSDGIERGLFRNFSEHDFFRIWTAKEAVLKMLGKGLGGLGSCRIYKVVSEFLLIVCCQEQYFPAVCYSRCGYIVTVIGMPDCVEFVHSY